MRHPILMVGGAMFAAIVLASAGNRVDSIAGDGTARDSVDFGTSTAAGYVGEMFAIPGKVMGEVRPELQNMQAQTSGLLGPPPTAPSTAGPTGDLNGSQP